VKLGGKESEYLPFSLVYHGLNDRRIQRLFVVDEAGAMVGVLTERFRRPSPPR
jgi:hypothetical protein